MIKHLLPLVLFVATTATAASERDAKKLANDPLVGTWLVKVPGPTPQDTFYALHTYHAGGTFTEVSSLLPGLAESPSHGTWERDGDDYKLTFILFRWDQGVLTGYIQVRCRLKLTGDRIDATYIVDLIEPDGTIVPAVGTGPFFGLRQKIDAFGLKIDVPAPDASETQAQMVLPEDAPAPRAWRHRGR